MANDQHGDTVTGERCQASLAAFLGAGLPTPPSITLMVLVLASARREVAAREHHGHPVDQWLVSGVRQRGIKESAAVLAVLENLRTALRPPGPTASSTPTDQPY